MFWERFSELCEKAGTKPNPVGKEIGISSGIITKWKNEKTLPNGETLLKIAIYFNVSVDYLLGRTNCPEINTGPLVEYIDAGTTSLDIPVEMKRIDSNITVLVKKGTEITEKDKEEITRILEENKAKEK